VSELYKLPKGWEWKNISDVISDIKTGTTPPKKEQKYYDNPTINWFSPSDFGEHKELTYSKNKINKIAIVDKKAKIYQPNSLLLVAIGATVGKIGIIREEASSNQQITVMSFKNNINIDFSYYWFVKIKQIIIDTASAATLPIINQKGIKSLLFPLPPLLEQKRIVSKLDNLFCKIDKAIILLQNNIDEIDAFMGSVLNDVFEELEKQYGKTSISSVMKINNQTIVPDDNKMYNYVGLENIESNSGKLVDYAPSIGKDIKSSKVHFEKGMVLYGKLRPYLNKVWIADFDGIATTEILPFFPIDNNLSMEYVKHYFLSPKYLAKVMSNCSGARMPRLTTKFIKSNEAYIPMPSLKIQQKVVTYLDEISQKIEKIKSVQKDKMENLTKLKVSILDQAFRGEL